MPDPLAELEQAALRHPRPGPPVRSARQSIPGQVALGLGLLQWGYWVLVVGKAWYEWNLPTGQLHGVMEAEGFCVIYALDVGLALPLAAAGMADRWHQNSYAKWAVGLIVAFMASPFVALMILALVQRWRGG